MPCASQINSSQADSKVLCAAGLFPDRWQLPLSLVSLETTGGATPGEAPAVSAPPGQQRLALVELHMQLPDVQTPVEAARSHCAKRCWSCNPPLRCKQCKSACNCPLVPFCLPACLLCCPAWLRSRATQCAQCYGKMFD